MKTKIAETHEQETFCAFDEMVLVEALIPHPENPNTHPPNQIAILAKNIQVRGWRHPIIRSTLSGFIVAGHARLEAAKALDLESVPVNHQSFTDEADELGFVLADNKIAELAERFLPLKLIGALLAKETSWTADVPPLKYDARMKTFLGRRTNLFSHDEGAG